MSVPTADLVLKNANVITMDHSQPTAELVAIKGDKILLVASNEELEQVKTATTKVINCEGRTVIPGFNDAHCHVFSLIWNPCFSRCFGAFLYVAMSPHERGVIVLLFNAGIVM